MLLEYTSYSKWGAKIILWQTDPSGKREYRFAPDGDVPDELGKKLLEQLSAEFKLIEPKPAEVIPQPVEAQKEDDFKCPHCEFEGKSKGSLSAHIRFKHKENKHEVPA